MDTKFKVVNYHFHLKENNKLVIIGYFPFDEGNERRLSVKYNNENANMQIATDHNNDVRRRYISTDDNVSVEYTITIILPSNSNEWNRLVLCDEEECILSLSGKALRKLQREFNYNFDSSVVSENTIRLIGWAASGSEEKVRLFDGEEEIKISVKRSFRKDLLGIYKELGGNSQAGLEIEFEKYNYKDLWVEFEVDEKKYRFQLDTKQVINGGQISKPEKFVVKVARKLKQDGAKKTFTKVVGKKLHKEENPYMEFIEKYGIKEDELEEERKVQFDYLPKFSIVVPMFKTNEVFLYELINSVLAQTYGNFELCLADGSPDDNLGRIIARKYKDDRIVYKHLKENGGIAENTNQGMEMATGDFIVLSDHDDTIAPDALFECAKALNKDKTIDIIYSDEDKVSMEGNVYFDPSFKPDFNLDYLRSVNYICHLFVFKREIFEKAGCFRKEFDGAQDHDFILRCTEIAKNIYHIPKVLYHWRCHIDSTAMNLESKLYALDNGAKAVTEHYKRMGLPARAERGEFYGTYHTIYDWNKEPLVSIIIPTKDQSETLRECINSIESKNNYKNIEFIIVENNSVEKETFEYYDELKKKSNFKIVTYTGDFNYSAINNFGASYANGEMLLLLNNDTALIEGNSIKEMVDTCIREDVGICGAMLYYPDDTIQHAGVIMGIGGIAGHAFVGLKRALPGYMYRAAVTQDLTAVTAACLMIKKSVFDEVGGLTEKLAVAFNDVDLCLKVRKKGYLVVFNPYSQFYHFESKSRGLENTPEKIERFNGEIKILEEFWPDVLKNGDMYFNPNLSLTDGMYKLKK